MGDEPLTIGGRGRPGRVPNHRRRSCRGSLWCCGSAAARWYSPWSCSWTLARTTDANRSSYGVPVTPRHPARPLAPGPAQFSGRAAPVVCHRQGRHRRRRSPLPCHRLRPTDRKGPLRGQRGPAGHQPLFDIKPRRESRSSPAPPAAACGGLACGTGRASGYLRSSSPRLGRADSLLRAARMPSTSRRPLALGLRGRAPHRQGP